MKIWLLKGNDYGDRRYNGDLEKFPSKFKNERGVLNLGKIPYYKIDSWNLDRF